MAEVFGVVASSLAVAELTAKFGVSMVKLKVFFKKDEIQEYKAKLQYILQLVLICQQTHAVTQQSHMILRDNVQISAGNKELCAADAELQSV
ncbi:hypothetical protein CTRI78_v009700 [Colletotrichum trifolii]|uniref:Uncharacterized protein n=1 Tax=Colletotrichum trifolii TaxID=5466 RepID=A0A4V3HTW4_COLTR|nr:hypothetical protein CTRI78_v009700 [Colletotrichum trifolii]